MARLEQVLRDEIRRLARREMKPATETLRKHNAQLKRTVADLKRRVAVLERTASALLAQRRAGAPAAPGEIEKARITGPSIKKLRARLGLSQAQLAALTGVSPQSVYHWEKRTGRLALRGKSMAAVVELRKLGKREVNKRLEALA